jgi:hypothetical protein
MRVASTRTLGDDRGGTSVALLLTAIFIVGVPLPAIEEGLKEMLVPLFCPVADNAMDEAV